MQVFLSLMAGNQVSVDLTQIPHPTDELKLDFQVKGCFCTEHPEHFNPPLPNGLCDAGSHPGPYKPRGGELYTTYTWEAGEHCNCPQHRHRLPMHAIHTGS